MMGNTRLIFKVLLSLARAQPPVARAQAPLSGAKLESAHIVSSQASQASQS